MLKMDKMFPRSQNIFGLVIKLH